MEVGVLPRAGNGVIVAAEKTPLAADDGTLAALGALTHGKIRTMTVTMTYDLYPIIDDLARSSS
ncbi:MAG: hypothetical protein HYW65_03260 [Candidatus Liptonbacteria bacterium]|nr:hypothetical protein [Candidatus Liptonbacteria bacterium]